MCGGPPTFFEPLEGHTSHKENFERNKASLPKITQDLVHVS